MRKDTILCALGVLLVAGSQAVTLQENLAFPAMDVIVSQQAWNSQGPVQDRVTGSGSTLENSIGQSFNLTNSTILRAITFQSHQSWSWDTNSVHELRLWVGKNEGTASYFMAGTTNLLTTIDLAGKSVETLGYYTLNLDEDLILPAGNYGFQMEWTTQDTANFTYLKRLTAGSSYTNGAYLTDSSAGGTVPFDLASVSTGGDLVFGLHSTPVGVASTAVTVNPESINMSFALDVDSVSDASSIAYLTPSGSNVVVSSITFSDESHPGAFTNVMAVPLVLSNAFPSTTSVPFMFDNSIGGLLAGETATATAILNWYEEGGTNGQVSLALSATGTPRLPKSTMTSTGSIFPTNNVLVGQQVLTEDGTSFIRSGSDLGGGQTFTLDANQILTGFTFYVKNGQNFTDADDHIFKMWVGGMSGTIAGETLYETSVSLSNYNFSVGYHRLDFAEELSLDAGTYGVQVAWANEDDQNSIRLGNSQTNVYDGGTGQRFSSDGTLPVNNGAFAWDWVFAVHGRPGPVGYEAWLGKYDLGISTNKTDNPDGDAYNNLYEYAFGGNPTNGTDIGYPTPLAYSVENDGSTPWLEYVYARRIAATQELVYSLEMGSDLVYTNWAARSYIELPETGIMAENPAFETVTNRIDISEPSIEFIRAHVDELY